MNNAKLVIDFQDEQFEEEKAPVIRQRQVEVVQIIESLQRIADSEDWRTLNTLVFKGLVETLKERIHVEATNKTINSDELHRLNGQLTWAKRYSDLYKLIDVYKLELTTLRNKLNANN